MRKIFKRVFLGLGFVIFTAIFVSLANQFILTLITEESVENYNEFLEKSFDEVFEKKYFVGLQAQKRKRGDAFRVIFNLAKEQALKNDKPLVIVETGSIRRPYLSLSGDGSSTLIFNHFATTYKAKVYSVDTNPICKDIIENVFKLKHVKGVTLDSIDYLRSFEHPEDISILYLDSFDVDFNKSDPSASHHLKEIEVIFDKLSPGTLIAVDDNISINNKSVGKGYKVEKYLDDKAYKIYDGYIKVFQVK